MNIMNDLQVLRINPFALQLLAESVLKCPVVERMSDEPLAVPFPIHREDCSGWSGVMITLQPVKADQPFPTPFPDQVRVLKAALEANHKWHKDYDDHGTYPGSELCALNCAALGIPE